MAWRIRHQGSASEVTGVTPDDIVDGIRNGVWEATDEVRGPNDPSWVMLGDHPVFQEIVEEIESFTENRHPDETHLDMNALIDVCLVLLVFFILVTSHATVIQKIVPVAAVIDPETGLRKAPITQTQVQKYMVRLRAKCDKDGVAPTLWVEGEKVDAWDAELQDVDVGKLAGQIRKHVDRRSGKIELLLQLEDVSWGTVVSIQDAAREAGIRTIHQQKQ